MRKAAPRGTPIIQRQDCDFFFKDLAGQFVKAKG